jgi:hypothetical protein
MLVNVSFTEYGGMYMYINTKLNLEAAKMFIYVYRNLMIWIRFDLD